MGDLGKEIKSKFDNEWVKALINIKYTSVYLDSVANKIFRPYNISEQQYNVLRILRGADEQITVNSVKERMIQKSPNSTRLMDKLCEKKLISRVRCESDRRVVYVEITKEGLDLLDKIDLRELNEFAKSLTEKEAKTLNSLLDKIR